MQLCSMTWVMLPSAIPYPFPPSPLSSEVHSNSQNLQNCSLPGYGTVQSDWLVPRFASEYTASIFRWPVKTDPECSSETFINMYQTIHCPHRDCITNPHHCENLKSCTTKCEEQLKCGCKCHIGKTELQKSSTFYTYTVLNTTSFSTNCVHFVSYFASQTI